MEITRARVLIISDGRTGSVNQSLGLAAMLGFKAPEVLELRKKITSPLLRWLPVSMLYSNLAGIEKTAGKADLLIGAGHAVSRVLRHLKGQQPQLFTVALMRPSGKLAAYDVVAVPRHDGLQPAENLIHTLGNCNRITKDLLAQEADRWGKRLQHLKGYKMAVLLGGTSKHGAFTPADATALIAGLTQAIKQQATQGASLLVSTSRRTGPEVTAALQAALALSGVPFYLWQPEAENARDNPYFAYLALADTVLITADSTSMISEAATAGKPIYIYGNEAKLPKKFKAFYAALAKQGRVFFWASAKPEQNPLGLRPPAAGVLDTLLVAGFVRARWQKRFGNKNLI